MMTIVRPLLGTLAASFIQAFFLCFTDFGIPASVGGKYEVIASVLYNQMLGSIPDFARGAVVAMVMLVPSVISITVLQFLEKYNVRYSRISTIEISRHRLRDIACGGVSAAIILCVLSVFAVIFIVPFISEWPYDIRFTMEHAVSVLEDDALSGVVRNSLVAALFTAVAGTLVAYGSALVTARSTVSKKLKNVIEGIALVTNTIPGW